MQDDNDNQRNNYRVTPSFEQSVRVELVSDESDSFPVAISDISAGGAGVVVPEDFPVLTPGAKVVLRFTAPNRLFKPLEISGEVRHCRQMTMSMRYGVQFTHWTDARHDLGPKLRSLFNERQAVRIEPEPSTPIMVKVTKDRQDSSQSAQMRDISVMGLGLIFELAALDSIDANDMLQLDFTLPTAAEAPISVHATVQHIRKDQFSLHAFCGVQFVDTRSANLRTHLRTMTEYVMQRQVEMLRRQADEP